MRFIILFFISIHGLGQCPPQGDNKNVKIQAIDLLKNRQYFIKDSAKQVVFELLAKDGILDTGMIFVDAFITSAKISGAESCQCHDNNPLTRDYHIYISNTKGDKLGKHNQIVEVSRYSRQLNPSLDFNYVKSMIGKKVRIYGYAFMDEEHKSAIGSWREGIQEIHPVFFIEPLN